MNICAREWAIVCGRPLLCINGFGKTEIECNLWDDLPPEVEIAPCAQPIDGRDRVGVEHVMLVGINAVGPLAGIEELQASANTNRRLNKTIGDILIDRNTVG